MKLKLSKTEDTMLPQGVGFSVECVANGPLDDGMSLLWYRDNEPLTISNHFNITSPVSYGIQHDQCYTLTISSFFKLMETALV